MHPMEKAFWKLLKGKIKCNNTPLKVVNRLKSTDQTPCITIEQASEIQINRDYRTDTTQRMIYTNDCEIWVNIWCDTEEERHEIISQIKLLFFKALANHYSTCSNYEKNTNNCKFLNKECEALTLLNSRSAKNQCPFPSKNRYTSWFKKYHIIKNSFRLAGISNMDELDIAEPVLRTLIKFNLNYIISYNLGGIIPTSVMVEDLK